MTSAKPNTPAALKEIASHYFLSLCNTRDLAAAQSLMADDIIVQHDDFEPVRGAVAYLERWGTILRAHGGMRIVIANAIAEVDEQAGGGGKVWIYSNVYDDVGDLERDSVDMVVVSPEGKIKSSKDCQRIIKQHAVGQSH